MQSESPAVSGFNGQPLPFWLRIPNAIDERVGRSDGQLTPENLIRAACRRTGLADRFPAHVVTALEILCRSLRDDARLHWFGRLNERTLIVTGLAELLRVNEVFRKQPELESTRLNSPLIVVGLPRSGTTFLHRLLASDADAMPVPLYRHIFPTERRAPTQLTEAACLFEPWKRAGRRYRIDAMHFVRPGLPDECNFGMRLAMRSMIFWAIAPAYGYMNWLLEQDLAETYRLYRRVLILHQLRDPQKRLTLKCPSHVIALPSLIKAIPEAQIVQTHRDPLEAVPSENKLGVALHSLSVSKMDWRKTVAHNYRRLRVYAERSVDFARSDTNSKVTHVSYRRIVTDPVGLAREVHETNGLHWDTARQASLASYCSANRQHKRGANRYSLEQFELCPKAIAADFREYYDCFLSGDRTATGTEDPGLAATV